MPFLCMSGEETGRQGATNDKSVDNVSVGQQDRKRCRAGIVVVTQTGPDVCGHERRQYF